MKKYITISAVLLLLVLVFVFWNGRQTQEGGDVRERARNALRARASTKVQRPRVPPTERSAAVQPAARSEPTIDSDLNLYDTRIGNNPLNLSEEQMRQIQVAYQSLIDRRHRYESGHCEVQSAPGGAKNIRIPAYLSEGAAMYADFLEEVSSVIGGDTDIFEELYGPSVVISNFGLGQFDQNILVTRKKAFVEIEHQSTSLTGGDGLRMKITSKRGSTLLESNLMSYEFLRSKILP